MAPTDVPGRSALLAELRRADIVEPEEVPRDVATMNSTVRFEIESTGEKFLMALVYPWEGDGSPNQVPI